MSAPEFMRNLFECFEQHSDSYCSNRYVVKREIESTDRAIDRLVYELYWLTEKEVGIVESP